VCNHFRPEEGGVALGKETMKKPLLIAVLTLTLVGCGVDPPSQGGHTWTNTLNWAYPGIAEQHHVMPVDGENRTWILQRPIDHLPGEQLPVIVILHGHRATAETMAGHFEDRVATRRFIGVYPQGWGETWNTGECCWPALDSFINDFAFFDDILDYLETRPDVDADQISISGGSLGGMMAFEYACSRADRLSGLVSIAGTRIEPCRPNAPIPTMQIHSLTDDSFAYDGGETITEWLMGIKFPAVVPSLQEWAEANGDCPEGPTISQEEVMPIAMATLWDCGGTITRLDTLSWGGHAWPVVGDYIVVDHLIDFLIGSN
jgi:polyhydroxybutyrate depolymerase